MANNTEQTYIIPCFTVSLYVVIFSLKHKYANISVLLFCLQLRNITQNVETILFARCLLLICTSI